MSKRRLISLILALILTVTLISALISCNRKPGQTDEPTGDVNTEAPTENPDDNQWVSCEHEYDNACDPDCNKCDEPRRPSDHFYDDDEDAECNECGYVRDLACKHEYDNACDDDCNLCGEERTPADHVSVVIPGKAATCTEAGLTDGAKCSVCGKIIAEQTAVPATGHKYDNACDADCNVCGDERTPAEHVYDDDSDVDCNECGEIREILCVHEYDNACDDDCNLCGEKRIPAAHVVEIIPGKDATCTEEGLTDGEKCSVCGVIIKEQAAIVAGHSYDNACDADCNKCGEERTPADHVAIPVEGYDATCTEAGLSDGEKCGICGVIITEQTAINPLGHRNEYVSDADGHYLHCTACGENGEPAAHTYDGGVCTACRYLCQHVPGPEATCTTAQICTVCNHVLEAAREHRLTAEATCVTDQVCRICGHVEKEAFGHSYSSECDAICDVCGDSRTVSAEHSAQIVDAKAPTCTTDGYTAGSVCSKCGASITGHERLPAKGHSYDSSCDVDCNTCGEVRDTVEHVYSNGCDVDCNECGAERDSSLLSHSYDNDCDVDCNECGAVRDGGHLFDGPCDADCNRECGFTREAGEHAYEYECSNACKFCGTEREASHIYDNDCDGVCNACGTMRQASHSFSTAWTKGETAHWQECTVCGAKQLKAAHTYTTACDADCNECGATRVAAAHVYDNKCDTDCNTCFATRTVGAHTNTVAYDETAHWNVCQECGAISGRAAHSYNNGACSCGRKADPCSHSFLNDCSTVCGICGEVREPAADHKYAPKSDEFNHWQECSVCGDIKNTQSHTLVESSVDEKTHNLACVVCGYVGGEAEPHAFVEGVCSCGYESTCAHTGGEATCVQLAVCTVCGCEYGEYAAHTENVVSPEVAPSCTGSGITAAIQCSVCEKWVQEPTTIPALGHKIVETAGKAPTCTETGLTVGKACSVCGHTEAQQETIPVLEHSYQQNGYVAPTCEVPGSVSYICVHCSADKTETVAATGHSESAWVVTVVPTCTDMGEEKQYCKNCGTELGTQPVNAKGHAWGEGVVTAPTCTAGGYTTKTCSTCKAISIEDQTIPAGHTWSDVIDRKATCTVDGTMHQECSTCGAWGNVTPIFAAGQHEWSETLEYNANGHWLTCKNCEETDAVESHSLQGDGVCDCGYTCTHTGGTANCLALATCTICGCEYGSLGEHIPGAAATCDNDQVCALCSTVITQATGHTNIVDDAAVEPGCTTVGLTAGQHCGDCGAIILEQNKINANGHKYGDDNICTVCGEGKSSGDVCEHAYDDCVDTSCNLCGDERTAPGHIEVYVSGTAATCTTTGLTAGKKCVACEAETLAQTEIPALGHTSVRWVVDRIASCNNDGYEYEICNICGERTGNEVTTPVTEHEYIKVDVASTCQVAGYTTETCKHCNASKDLVQKELAPHTPGDWKVSLAADCNQAGSEYQICSVCGLETGETREIPKLTHVETAKVTLPTCDADGYTTYTCTLCNAARTEVNAGSATGHTSGGWVVDVKPSCTTAGTKSEICAVCGNRTGNSESIDALGHNYVGEVAVEPTCEYEGEGIYRCTVCGAVDEENTFTVAKLPHTASNWITDVEAGCESEGKRYIECTVCFATIEEQTISALGHNYVVRVEGNKVVTTCTGGCGYYNAEDVAVGEHTHTLGGYRIETNATCTAPGVKYAVCASCGSDMGDAIEIPALDHDYYSVTVAPTCRAQGYTTKTCNRCADTVTEYTDAIPCVSGGWVIDSAAGCDYTGTKHEVCINCGSQIGETVEIAATGHSYVKTVTAPTCTDAGYTEYECACGAYYEGDATEATGHVSGGWVIDTAATCTTTGTKHEVCAICSATMGDAVVIPAAEHDIATIVILPTCTEQGYTINTCKSCGTTERTDYVTAAGHNESGWIIASSATCDAEGSRYTVCTVCGSRMSVGTIDATDHKYEEQVIAPKCSATGEGTDGYTLHYCVDCGATYTDNVIEPSHTFTDDDDATCNECGFWRNTAAECEHQYSSACDATCNVCGAVREASAHVEETIPGKAATCTETGLTEGKRCTVCGAVTVVQTTLAKTTHTYDNDCDASCNVCGAVRVTADHKYDHGCDIDCNVCGARRQPESHKYDNNCDATCNVCGAERTPSDHTYSNACDATCDECGATRVAADHTYDDCYDTECNECGKKRAVTHNYGGDNICDDCGYELTCDHVYTDCTDETCNLCGSTRTAPGHSGGTATCTRKATCEVCGKTYGDTIPHTPNIPAATCTDNQVCTVCNRTITQKLGHNYVAAVTDATCTEQGFTTNTCSHCGDSYISNYVAALGHAIVDVPGYAATCTATGLTTGKACSRCGLVTVSQTEIAKLPHSYGNDNFCDNCNFEKIECPHDWAGTCNAECGLCGEIRTVTHDYDTSKYVYSETTHWYACSICGAKNNETSHAYDNSCDTTCNADGCGYTRTTTHRFSSSWTKDASGHWHVCSVCKETTTTEKHAYDNVCDTTCGTCNYRRTVEHAYSSTYSTDGTYHWYACTTSGCTSTTTKTVHSYDNTCDTTCGECGYTRTTTHQYSSTWTKGDNGHWHVCSVCGEIDAIKAHAWDNGCDTACNTCGYTRTTTHTYDNATCDTTCNECGATRSVTHNYSTFWSTNASQHWYACLTCGATKGNANHVYVNSCDADCNTCGYTRATDHTWGSTWQKNASGHYHVCSKCNASSAVITHTYDNNCDTTCNECGYTRSIAHSYATTYSYDSNTHWYACTVCGAKQNENPHVYSNACDTTCNTSGCGGTRTTSHSFSSDYTKDTVGHWYQCSSCGETTGYGTHDYTNDCDTKCDACGQTRSITHTYDNSCDTTCNVCGATRTISHSYYSTYESDSSGHWQSCSVCGVKRNESIHNDGDSSGECDTCGYNMSVSHNYSSTYTYDSTHHWYKCTDAGCNEVSGKTTHKYTNNCDATCNGCGYTRTVTHTYGTAWKSDANGHWHVCIICSAVGTSTQHTWDNGCDTNCNDCGYAREAAHDYDNGCDSDCNTCGKTRTVPHSYGDYYATNESQHWYQCADCGVTKGTANHSYDNNCDEYCNVCNYKRKVEHTYSTLWTKDSTNHWHVCTICGSKTDVFAHTYSNACDTTCDSCGQTRSVGDHQWSSTYTSNANYHWYRCTACGLEKNKGVHVFDSVCDAECNTCGYTRTGTSHEYATTLTSDSTSHWYACTKCGAKNNEVNHAYDNACDTTCNTSGCGYIRSIAHSYATTYSSNGTHHWQACSTCGMERNKASHAWSNTCDDKCDTCGYTRTTTHSYSVTYSSDANNHWFACIVCGAKTNSAAHVWANDCDTSCNTCGYTRTTTHKYDNNCDTTCNTCGATRSISHAYGSTWSTDDTYHWYQCSVCGAKKSMATHNYSSATDTTCDSCGKTRDLAACQHVYDNACGDKTCNLCGETRTNMADHTYDNLCDTTCNVCNQVARTATHTYDHSCDADCNVCGATRSTSHSYSSSYSMDADNHWKACVACGAIQGSAQAHTYGSSCDESCNTCGYTRVTEHTWESTISTDANYHWYKCSVCGAAKDKNAHNFTNSCDTSCGDCGYTRSITHSYGSGYTVDANNHWYQCTVCGNKTGTGAHVFKLTSISNTQHTKSCSTCKYVASTDSHVFDANNKCECGAEKVIVETYATSVDYINKNGPYTGYGSNSVDGVQSIKGHGTDFYGKLSIAGWCVTDSGIAGYYYSLDDGKTWVAIDTTGCLTNATSAHVGTASGKAGVSSDAPTANCVFASTTPLTIDLSAYWGQTFDVTIAAATGSGVYVKIIVLEDVTVWNPQANGRPVVPFDYTNGLVVGYSMDYLKINGGHWTVNKNAADGTAKTPYAQNHTAVTIRSGEYVTLGGWMGYSSKTISSFGYFYADKPVAVTLSTSFMGTAESAVITAGGANAKRFVIDIDTSGLSDGVHRVYFVAQLGDGSIAIIQYVDLYVVGADDDYVSGSDVADSQVQVAVKDETTSFSTAPSSKSGNTYTMYNGLKFTTSASYNSSSYRLTVPSSGITLSFPDGQFSEFNRFKLQFSASVPMKVVMTYRDGGGTALTDTFYLESGQGTFTCVILDFLEGATAKDIDSFTIYPLGSSSGLFMLAHISTEMAEWDLGNMTYIQNARFKVGTRLSWGGALCYFEDKNDGNTSVRNLINIYDEGRLIQQSWYNANVITGLYNGAKWKYNPVQGGDWIGNDSRLIDVVIEDFSMYVKSQPMDWGAGTDGATATITPSYMENWYTVYSDRVVVKNRFYDYSGYAATGTCNQEVPAMYFIGWLNSFAYDGSSGDWNSVNYVYKTALPFWSGGSGDSNVFDPNYAITTRFAVSGSETWGAWYNASSGFAFGFYIPGIVRFISGRNQYNIYGDTTSAFSAGCNYTAAGCEANLQAFKAYTYSYMLTTGSSVQAVRNTFYNYRGFVTNTFT
ncbi:MAG: hypothetical protein IJW65_06560 [Clostridia bacterium]|nr:hypothetical protein [Clostridia bacterium]